MTEPPPLPTPPLYRIPWEIYDRMVELGALGPREKAVLLDGLLVARKPKGPRYCTTINRGYAALRAVVPAGWMAAPWQPVVLRGGPCGDSVPEPDLVVFFGSPDRYIRRHPVGAEVGMVIEVASNPEDLRIDRAGLARYAHANIPITCVVNLPDRSIERYSGPTGPVDEPRYRNRKILRPEQSLAGEIGTALTGPAALGPVSVASFFASEHHPEV